MKEAWMRKNYSESDKVSDAQIRAAIMELVTERGAGKSICPSEAARWLSPDQWRNHLSRVRETAKELAAHGQISILRKGKVVDDPASVKGVIRLSLPNPSAAD